MDTPLRAVSARLGLRERRGHAAEPADRATTAAPGTPPEPATFAGFVERYVVELQRDARAACVVVGAPTHEAEDLLHDGLEVLADRWEKARTVRAGPRGYLYGVMRRIALGRRTGRTGADRVVIATTSLPEGHEAWRSPARTPEEEAVHLERVASLWAALHRLPVRQREVVVLIDLREQSIAETAALLRRREGAVRTAHHRALRTLRALLDEDEGGTS